MINLIPKPGEVKLKGGTFVIEKNAEIYSEFPLPLVCTCDNENAEIRILRDGAVEAEGYLLNVDQSGILIKASDRAGAYYALQSVRMLSGYDEGKNEIPFLEIQDKPRYKWRGLSLDESRHFFGKECVKAYLDDMFRLKLNVFHWHLTDDNGWRIEIKKYPLLTEIGSKRDYTQRGGWCCDRIENKEHSGFYTQEDIKEIVEYAAERCISIVPEIDVPAHFAAALAAYPELACRNIPCSVFGFFGGLVPKKQGIKNWNRPACMGKDKTLQFIFDVYDEVCSLFPFEYFHVGGDECDVSEWKKCPDCQRVMKENGFSNEQQLQSRLTNQLCEFLKSKGKHMLAWNDILRKGADEIDTDVVVQQWLPGQDKNTKQFAKNGGKIIMSNHKSFYFDMPYAMYPLKYTYDFSPSRYGINEKESLIGIEGEVWTEWISTWDKVQLLTHPRAEALAEVAWSTDENRNFDEFCQRYNSSKGTLKALGINYAEDEIAMPRGCFNRLHIKRKFKCGNPDLELQKNKLCKEK